MYNSSLITPYYVHLTRRKQLTKVTAQFARGISQLNWKVKTFRLKIHNFMTNKEFIKPII